MIPQSSTEILALHGGVPVRAAVLPYGRHQIDEADIQAVAEVLRSNWLTSGPRVDEFEKAVAAAVSADHAVAVSSGTAALHAAVFAIDVGPGDEVIVPPLTFAASANVVVYQGATPVFADIDPRTLLLDPAQVSRKVSARTKAIIAVDYAGQPCDYPALRRAAPGIAIIADACHALGARDGRMPVGSIADVTAFSFHPVKHVTTGEGGAVTTSDAALAARMRIFRNHGISVDHRQREASSSWFYEISELGFNYRLTDIQCALGVSQMAKLDAIVARRNAIALEYINAFRGLPEIRPLHNRSDVRHAYHLFVVRVDFDLLTCLRPTFFAALRAEGIGVNVHYVPVHLHPFYRRTFGTGPGLAPAAEAAYEEIVTLPMFPGMTRQDTRDVIDAVAKVVGAYRKAP